MVNEELKELLDDFLLEAEERLTRIEVSLLASVEADAESRQRSFREVRRELHTLKGNSGMMGLGELQALAHELEDEVDRLEPTDPDLTSLLAGLDRFKNDLRKVASENGPPTSSTQVSPAPAGFPRAPVRDRREGSTRVRLDRLNQLLETSIRLVVARNRLRDRIELGATLDPGDPEFGPTTRQAWRDTEEAHRELDQTLELLQEQVRDLRTIPLKSVFSRLQRLVHDESRRTGKEVAFEHRGGETPLDSALTELATDTLGHLIRNCIVHGLEEPALRETRNKPRQGMVFLEASLRAGDVEIEVFDDGAGIDEPALRRAAKRAGIEQSESADLHALLFHPGLSTRRSADHSSGRGIGLSAVLASVHRHGGTIQVDTSAGVGTRFCLRLPLTVAITDALLVRSGTERFAIPISAVRDTGSMESLERESMELHQFLNLPLGGEPDFYFTVEAEGRSSTLRVNELGTIQRIVVNPLDELFGRPKGVAGTTVLGDGRVVLILDPPQLAAAGTETARTVSTDPSNQPRTGDL